MFDLGKKSGHHHHPDVSDEEMAEFVNINQMYKQMDHVLDVLKEEYMKNVSLRVNVGELINILN